MEGCASLALHGSLYFVALYMHVKDPTYSPLWLLIIFTSSLCLFGDLLTISHRCFGIALPDLMVSPWRATSLKSFWGERWNTVIGGHLASYVYVPLRKHGFSRFYTNHSCTWRFTLALIVRLAGTMCTFIASGLVHAYPYILGGGTLGGACSIVEYFIVQATLVSLEVVLTNGSTPGPPRGVYMYLAWARTMLLVALPTPLLTAPLLSL